MAPNISLRFTINPTLPTPSCLFNEQIATIPLTLLGITATQSAESLHLPHRFHATKEHTIAWNLESNIPRDDMPEPNSNTVGSAGLGLATKKKHIQDSSRTSSVYTTQTKLTKKPTKTSQSKATTNEAPQRSLQKPQEKQAGMMSANSTPAPSYDSIPLDCGDFVDSDHECDIEDESEDTLQYLNGYFYPVRIGDVLNRRYQVVHKLGRGGFSTVLAGS